MKKITIDGGFELSGTVKVSGAKNSVVALIPAAILSDEEVIIDNVPNISDTEALIDILKHINCDVIYKDETITINTKKIENKVIPEELSQKLRASYYFMGALLGKYKRAEMYFPGGCNIGQRPINFHIKGFEELGAKVTIEGDKYIIEADKLVGTRIYLDFASVGATINLMLAAVKAEGTTTICNAAKEPEIVNIASLLNNMGAKIFGAGTSEIKIHGVEKLTSARIEAIPDRIEAATYIIMGTLLGNNLEVKGIINEHVESLYHKLKDMGIKLDVKETSVVLNKTKQLKATNIKTLVFPGFVTDMGQPIQVLLTQANGKSIFEETIYENRMGHVPNLVKMGANIEQISNRIVYINGPKKLKGTTVEATDLRAGAAMIIAGLIAEGTTTITGVEHILRGYDNIIQKLQNVGAHITLIDE